MVKRFFALAIAVSLAACDPNVRIERVPYPQPVPCLSADQIPVEPPKVGADLTGNAELDANTLAASAIELRAWGQGLYNILRACSEKAQPNP